MATKRERNEESAPEKEPWLPRLTSGLRYEVVSTDDADHMGFVCKHCGYEGIPHRIKSAGRLTPDALDSGEGLSSQCPTCGRTEHGDGIMPDPNDPDEVVA